MTDREEAEGPPDPGLDPTRSPGFGEDVEALEDIEVGRDDITIGDASPAELTAADTEPVAEDDFADLVADLSDGDDIDRRRAALALADRGSADSRASEEISSALERAAREDPDPDVRQFAVEALAELDADRVAEVAKQALTDENPWVRAEAVVVLDGDDRERHAETIEDCLDDDHHAVRRNAIVSLAKHRGEDLLETLLEFVDDESERVREWVAEFLGSIDDERARESLDRLTHDESDIVAEAASNALDSDAERRELWTRSQSPVEATSRNTPPNL